MGRFFASSTALALTFSFATYSIDSAVAHDLRGIRQHFKHTKSATPQGRAAHAQRAEKFQALRELAKAALAPNFEASSHLEAKGFAGTFTSVAQGLAVASSRWPDDLQLTICFFDGPIAAQKT